MNTKYRMSDPNLALRCKETKKLHSILPLCLPGFLRSRNILQTSLNGFYAMPIHEPIHNTFSQLEKVELLFEIASVMVVLYRIIRICKVYEKCVEVNYVLQENDFIIHRLDFLLEWNSHLYSYVYWNEV